MNEQLNITICYKIKELEFIHWELKILVIRQKGKEKKRKPLRVEIVDVAFDLMGKNILIKLQTNNTNPNKAQQIK